VGGGNRWSSKWKSSNKRPLKLDQSPLSWLANSVHEPADEQTLCALGTFSSCAVRLNISQSLIYVTERGLETWRVPPVFLSSQDNKFETWWEIHSAAYINSSGAHENEYNQHFIQGDAVPLNVTRYSTHASGEDFLKRFLLEASDLHDNLKMYCWDLFVEHFERRKVFEQSEACGIKSRKCRHSPTSAKFTVRGFLKSEV
jgi:hypothetical protein